MGYLHFGMNLPKSLSVTSLLNLLSYFKSMFIAALVHLGLLKPAEQDHMVENPVHYVLVMNGICPTLLPVPVHVLTAQIKKKLPVVTFSDFLGRCEEEVPESDDDGKCPVCLDCLEQNHEVRELPNCCHVFHRECLDRWIDEGQVTCPLCRSVLYPDSAKAGASVCTLETWLKV